MRVFGITMVRDEAELIRVSIAHHLRAGVDHVLVVDNGSSDHVAEVLEAYAKEGRLSWSRDTGQWRQSEMMTALAREAHRRGADWILPFDADEFWVTARGSLRDVLSGTTAGALRVQLRNFIQARAQQDSVDPTSLLSMTRRVAEPAGPIEQCHEFVEANTIGFVEMMYPPKFISRSTAELQLAKGNHGVTGIPSAPEDTDRVLCLHAPLRSIESLKVKANAGRRVDAAAWAPGESWHLRRWRRLQEEGGAAALEAEWAANSFDERDSLDVYGKPHGLIVDHTLRELVAPLVASARISTRIG